MFPPVHLPIPAPGLQQRQDSWGAVPTTSQKWGVLLLCSQSLLAAERLSSSMQGRDKKSKVFHPGPRRGAGVGGPHLEAVGFPWKALRLVLAAETRGFSQ